MSAIVDAQIKARLLWFDAGQYQRPAAFRAGRPEVIDKLEIKRIYHGKISQRLCGGKSESFGERNPLQLPRMPRFISAAGGRNRQPAETGLTSDSLKPGERLASSSSASLWQTY